MKSLHVGDFFGVAAGVVGRSRPVMVEIVKTGVVDVCAAILAIGAFAALN